MNAPAPFELRIVRVRWAGKNQPLDVETAWSPTHLIADGRSGYVADITAYPEVSFRRSGQIGILTPDLLSPPVLILGGGESLQELFPVKASDGRTWWIERGKWKQFKDGNGYHDAPICRHAGAAHLRVGSVDLRLRISMPGFNEQEFAALLDEFKNGLWQLILDPKSPVTVSDRRADGGVSEAFLDAVRDHIRHAERALAQPHLELRERSEQQPLGRVRPTMRTFQELALRGAPRWITGRGHAPSYDTPENRLLVAMIFRLNRSIRSLQQASLDLAADFNRRADAAEAHAETLNGWVRVAPERLEQELAELRVRADALSKARQKLIIDETFNERVFEFKFKVNGSPENEYNKYGFWSNLISVVGKPNIRQSGLRLVFEQNQESVSITFKKGETYTVRGCLNLLKKGENKKGLWFIYEVVCLFSVNSSLECKVAAEINRLSTERSQLKQSDYQRKLSPRDVCEQENDRQADFFQAKRFRLERDQWESKAEALRPLASQTKKLIEKATILKISTGLNLTISGSMTYVQNADYRGALGAFRRALDAANLDISKIDQLFRLDEISILDMPKVYERWCLLKIIRILREQYGLMPTGTYRDDLFKGLAEHWNKTETIRIQFEGSHINRDVVLEYEPVLPTGRTPDFVITVIARRELPLSTDRVLHSDLIDSGPPIQFFDDPGPVNQEPHNPGPFDQSEYEQYLFDSSSFDPAPILTKDYPINQAKLVLDAKCKQFVPIASGQDGSDLTSELEELIVNRGYDENAANRVFVIHPGFDTKSAQEWERYCRYGGGHFTPNPEARPAWDQGEPDHRHGAVLLRPGTIDPLIRLITMHLYLSLEDTIHYYRTPPRYQPFCPACAGVDLTNISLPSIWPWKASCANSKCNHPIIRNYCWNCGTHLWKLGGYWTFHETRALNPYDIKCPHCEEYMIIPAPEPELEPGWKPNDSYPVY